jgi:hypothetical protein
MQDHTTGKMSMISQNKFEEMLGHGRNVCRIGDVFRVRRCYFEIETISEYGISAKGITRREFHEKKKIHKKILRK